MCLFKINMIMVIPCSRTNFIESWLFEMPERVGDLDTYDVLNWSIRERIAAGEKPVEVESGLYKLGNQVLLYWMGTLNRVDLAMELEQKPQSLVVNLVGKRPNLIGGPPHATDLYVAILDDNQTSLVISDTKLSDAGVNVWKRLVHMGYYITVYNTRNPGQSRKTIKTPSELDEFLGFDDSDYQSWRFVLSKPGTQIGETVSVFNTRRYRELAGMENP
jgi:hypothetical protein